MRISENHDVTTIEFFEIRKTDIRKRESRAAECFKDYNTIFDKEFWYHRLGRNLIQLNDENVEQKNHEHGLNECINPAKDLADSRF